MAVSGAEAGADRRRATALKDVPGAQPAKSIGHQGPPPGFALVFYEALIENRSSKVVYRIPRKPLKQNKGEPFVVRVRPRQGRLAAENLHLVCVMLILPSLFSASLIAACSEHTEVNAD